MGSVVASCELSCPKARGILVPPSGIEPASPALEGGFFFVFLNFIYLLYFWLFWVFVAAWGTHVMPCHQKAKKPTNPAYSRNLRSLMWLVQRLGGQRPHCVGSRWVSDKRSAPHLKRDGVAGILPARPG